MFRVSESGGAPSLVTAPEPSLGEVAYRWPQTLPDGRFLYFAQATKPENSGVYAASLTKPAERVKLLRTEGEAVYAPGAEGKDYLLWIRGATLVAQEFDPHTLRLGGEPQAIVDGPAGVRQARSQSPPPPTVCCCMAHFETWRSSLGGTGQGSRSAKWESRWRTYACSGSRPTNGTSSSNGSGGPSDLWLLDAERGVPSRFTADGTVSTQPVWSPDGHTILFSHLGSGSLLGKPANGAGDEQVVAQRPNETIPTDWSGDGRWVLTRERSPDTGYDIWKLPMLPDGKMPAGATPTPYLRTGFDEQMAGFRRSRSLGG